MPYCFNNRGFYRDEKLTKFVFVMTKPFKSYQCKKSTDNFHRAFNQSTLTLIKTNNNETKMQLRRIYTSSGEATLSKQFFASLLKRNLHQKKKMHSRWEYIFSFYCTPFQKGTAVQERKQEVTKSCLPCQTGPSCSKLPTALVNVSSKL